MAFRKKADVEKPLVPKLEPEGEPKLKKAQKVKKSIVKSQYENHPKFAKFKKGNN